MGTSRLNNIVESQIKYSTWQKMLCTPRLRPKLRIKLPPDSLNSVLLLQHQGLSDSSTPVFLCSLFPQLRFILLWVLLNDLVIWLLLTQFYGLFLLAFEISHAYGIYHCLSLDERWVPDRQPRGKKYIFAISKIEDTANGVCMWFKFAPLDSSSQDIWNTWPNKQEWFVIYLGSSTAASLVELRWQQ